MKNIRPSTKILLTFISTFFLSYIIINLITSSIKNREKHLHLEAAQIIQQDISEQFNLVLDNSRIIGELASVTIYNDIKASSTYVELVRQVLKEKDYIIGLNRLNPHGEIITIYPPEDNEKALGKKSQNFNDIRESYLKGEKYWFSAPFQLFQGKSGFVFYIPVVEKGKLLGWMAPVISSQQFFEHFRDIDFFKDYELVIKDKSTSLSYFETGLPNQAVDLQENTVKMWGREIVFQSWPKHPLSNFEISFFIKFLTCTLLSLFAALIVKTYLQKNRAYSRLDNISGLLGLTSNEAMAKLVDLQNEYLAHHENDRVEIEKNIQSVSNLIEQIELLQNYANTQPSQAEEFDLLPIFLEHIQSLREIIKKKNVDFNFDAGSFKEISIKGDKWLISNTVIKNILSYCALITRPSGKINISHKVVMQECTTLIHIDKICDAKMNETFKFDRRLMLVKNVMGHIDSKILLNNDSEGGLTLKLTRRVEKS